MGLPDRVASTFKNFSFCCCFVTRYRHFPPNYHFSVNLRPKLHQYRHLLHKTGRSVAVSWRKRLNSTLFCTLTERCQALHQRACSFSSLSCISYRGTPVPWMVGQRLDTKSNHCLISVQALSNVCPIK